MCFIFIRLVNYKGVHLSTSHMLLKMASLDPEYLKRSLTSLWARDDQFCQTFYDSSCLLFSLLTNKYISFSQMAAVHLAAQKRNQWHQCKMLQKTHQRSCLLWLYLHRSWFRKWISQLLESRGREIFCGHAKVQLFPQNGTQLRQEQCGAHVVVLCKQTANEKGISSKERRP